jgi:hypothetical protein
MVVMYFSVGERDIHVIYSEGAEIILEAIPNSIFSVKLLSATGAEKLPYMCIMELKEFHANLIT